MNIIRTFLDEVVQPNMATAMKNPGDLRAAVNAVLTLDALAGVLFSALKQIDHPSVDAISKKKDDQFRDRLAAGCHEFRVLRDLAAAYKHGELNNPKKNQPRLLLGPEHVDEIENEIGIMECGDEAGGAVLIITLADGGWIRASHVIGGSFQLLYPLVQEIA